MTYPLSSDVSAGQPTAVTHYNNLRSDAVYLGNLPADSVTLAAMLANYVTGLTIQYLATSRVRIPGSSSAPVLLMIDGVLCSAETNVDLPSLAAPSGAAAWWYFFAVKAAGTTIFTLDSNTSASESAAHRRIGRCYWDGSAITQLQTEEQYNLYNAFSLVPPQISNGRLTLTSAIPITMTDVSAAATLYFSPIWGNLVAVYKTGVGWIIRKFEELSITLVGTTASRPYDVFLYDNSGTLTLELLAWTNATTRATALVWKDGVQVKSGDPTRRFLGSVYINSSGGQTDDTEAKRNVQNAYNRVPRKLKVVEATDTWNYTTATWRSANGSNANRVEVMIGVAENPIWLYLQADCYNASNSQRSAGIGADVTNANSADIKGNVYFAGTESLRSIYIDVPSVGYHYYQWVEYSEAVGTSTWYGDNGSPTSKQSGMVGEVFS